MEEGKGKTRQRSVWVVLVLWGAVFVSLLILKYAPKGSWLFYAPIVVGPALVLKIVLSWGAELSTPRKARTRPPGVGVGLVGLVAMYVMMVVLFTPAYSASIRLGDRIVDKGGDVAWSDHGKLAYFALVTASTLGYGDVFPWPGSWRIQSLVCIQVIELWMFFLLAFAVVQTWLPPRRG